MKKLISIVLIVALSVGVLTGCCLKHEWTPATCAQPETCASCGKTQGEPLGHTWQDADCITPETCSLCGETQGKPLGHKGGDFVEVAVDIINAERKLEQKCTVCGEVTEDKTEVLQVLCKDGVFMFSPDEFWERYESIYGMWKEHPLCLFLTSDVLQDIPNDCKEIKIISQGASAISLNQDTDTINTELTKSATISFELTVVCCPGIEEDVLNKQLVELCNNALKTGYEEAKIGELTAIVQCIYLDNNLVYSFSLRTDM